MPTSILPQTVKEKWIKWIWREADVRSVVITEVTEENTVSLKMTPFSLVYIQQSFEVTCCLHLHASILYLLSWRWQQKVAVSYESFVNISQTTRSHIYSSTTTMEAAFSTSANKCLPNYTVSLSRRQLPSHYTANYTTDEGN